jgi:hypothetical protein
MLLALCIGSIWQGIALGEPLIVPMERETLVIQSGLDDWELVWHESKINRHWLVWVPSGETLEKHTQMFSVRRLQFSPDISATEYAEFQVEGLRHRHPTMVSTFLETSNDDTTLEYSWVDHERGTGSHALLRVVRSGDYLFGIAITSIGSEVPSEMREHWLSVLNGVERLHCCEADDKGLSLIPLLALYASFDFNQTPEMRLWFEVERDEKLGQDKAVLKSGGFPQDHEYDVFLISLSSTRDWHAMPFAQGLVADDSGALRCPEPTADRQADGRSEPDSGAAPAEEWIRPSKEGLEICEKLPGDFLSDMFQSVGVQFQPGLPIAAAVRSTDGSHATYAKFISVPIEGKDGKCSVTLELVSNDARTYVAYGSGFPADQTVSLALKYGKHRQTQAARTDSLGRFIAAINHPGEAAGRKKWQALLEASSSQCKVGVQYKWGEAGMKP